MQIRVTGRHIDVTPALQDHVERRLAKLEHIFHNLLDSHVILFHEKTENVVDITVTGNHLTLHVREREEDMYAAVDKAVHRLERQVRKHKQRLQGRTKAKMTHAARELQAAAVAEREHEAELDLSEQEEEEEAFDAPELVQEPEVHLEAAIPLTLEEAVTELRDHDHEFLAFMNKDSKSVEALFWRPDGHIGRVTSPQGAA